MVFPDAKPWSHEIYGIGLDRGELLNGFGWIPETTFGSVSGEKIFHVESAVHVRHNQPIPSSRSKQPGNTRNSEMADARPRSD